MAYSEQRVKKYFPKNYEKKARMDLVPRKTRSALRTRNINNNPLKQSVEKQPVDNLSCQITTINNTLNDLSNSIQILTDSIAELRSIIMSITPTDEDNTDTQQQE